MNNFSVFFVRLVLGAVFAVLLWRFFYPGANPVYVIGIGIILVGLAYFAEFLRNRKSR